MQQALQFSCAKPLAKFRQYLLDLIEEDLLNICHHGLDAAHSVVCAHELKFWESYQKFIDVWLRAFCKRCTKLAFL